ncbi:MAG: LemA family protein [Myxococcota bacterium]
MTIALIVVLLVVFGFIFYFVTIYNGLVSLKHNIDKAFSNIDVLLKQRFDEIPKLVSVCEGYMKHERETLEAVIKARSAIQSAGEGVAKFEAEGMLTNALKSLFAVSERYPELKADKGFNTLQGRISEIEDQIADRREFYNESVNLYNIRIEQFPDAFIAGIFSFTRRELWKIEPEHRADVKISFGVEKA